MLQPERRSNDKFTQNEADPGVRKTNAWNQKLDEVEKITDSLGYPIDEKVRQTIVGLNLLGLPTSASCEGHSDRARGAPWIRMEAPNKPRKRFIGEESIFRETARKYGVSYDEVRRGVNHEAWVEATNAACKNGETEEYKAWRKENEKIMEKISQLLDEYYKQRSVEPDLRFLLKANPEGTGTIHNGGIDFDVHHRTLTTGEKKSLTVRLQRYQEELRAFTDFLRNKYYNAA